MLLDRLKTNIRAVLKDTEKIVFVAHGLSIEKVSKAKRDVLDSLPRLLDVLNDHNIWKGGKH